MTGWPMVDALDHDWRHEPGGPDYYRCPNSDGSVAAIESHRALAAIRRGEPAIPSVYEQPAVQRTKMVIVPTWFVHPLATEIPERRR